MPAHIGQNHRWIVLALLMAMYALHTVDRYVIAVVMEPIRHEFRLSDSELGALGGVAHAIAFSAFILPMGWLVDRVNRVRLLSLLLGTWSALTMLGGVAANYWTLFIIRMGVGAAESGGNPSAISILCSLFPARERATALGLLYASTAFGTGLIFLLGGYIATAFGWRAVFLAAGLPGLVLAVILWTCLKEPARAAADEGGSGESGPDDGASKPLPMRDVARLFFTNPPLLFNVAGLTIAAMTVGSVWVWVSPCLIRMHGLSIAEAGLVVAMSAGVIKSASTAASGAIADRIAKGRVDRLWIVPAGALFLSVPMAVMMAMTPSTWLAIVCVMLLGTVLGAHHGPGFSVITSVVPAMARGRVTAMTQLSLNLIGLGLGPMVTGVISDALGGGNAIGWALAGTVSLNLVAAACFFLGGRAASRRQYGSA